VPAGSGRITRRTAAGQLSITTYSEHLPSSDNRSLSPPRLGARFASCLFLGFVPIGYN
jgi:hypothetical protein